MHMKEPIAEDKIGIARMKKFIFLFSLCIFSTLLNISAFAGGDLHPPSELKNADAMRHYGWPHLWHLRSLWLSASVRLPASAPNTLFLRANQC